MAKNEIRAVEMTRRIRAAHAEQMRDASPEERIRFYQEKAKTVDARIEARLRRGIRASD